MVGIELTVLDFNFTWMIVLISIAGLIYAVLLARQTMKHPTTGGDADRISNAIKTGANSYLRKQLTSIGVMVAILAAILIMLPTHQPEGFP